MPAALSSAGHRGENAGLLPARDIPMLRYTGPLLTRDTALVLLAARERGEARWAGSLDLGLTQGEALLEEDGWRWHGIAYP